MVQTIDFLFTIYIRALIAKVADSTRLHELVPKINTESLETLLGTISASMLVISYFWARWFQHFRQ
jgi:thioredoxin-like negative regulator of GroEL